MVTIFVIIADLSVAGEVSSDWHGGAVDVSVACFMQIFMKNTYWNEILCWHLEYPPVNLRLSQIVIPMWKKNEHKKINCGGKILRGAIQYHAWNFKEVF